MQRRQLVLGSIASLWAARGAWADAAEPTLSFAFDQDAFPTQYSLRAGTSVGVYPAIVAELCRMAGLPVSNLAAPFKRVVAGYITGGFAGGALIQTPERLAAGLYTRPYYVERLRPYFARKGSAPVRSVADLAGMRVGVIRGWAYGQEFDEARRKGLFQAEEVATGFQNFMKLQRGRLDCAVETELAAALFIPRLDGLAVVAGDFTLLQAPIHIGIPKQAPNATLLVARLDKAIADLTASGALQGVIERELRASADYLPLWLREHRLMNE